MIRKLVLLVALMGTSASLGGCATSHSWKGTPSATVTPKLASSATLVLTSTAFPTSTAIPSTTPTAVPALPVEEARARLLELLSDNGGCSLPCLWGITPGKSTYQDTQTIIAYLSSISDLPPYVGPEGVALSPTYAEGDLVLDVIVGFSIDLLSTEQTVNKIGLRARELEEIGFPSVFDSPSFAERAGYYMLPRLLSEQGIPTSVMIATEGGPLRNMEVGNFLIVLLYPDEGIWANYETQRHLIGSNVRGCPSPSNAHVELELFPSGNSGQFYELLGQTDWAVKEGWYRPLEEVTSMSVEEFHQTFRQPTGGCIDTPAELWPEPS